VRHPLKVELGAPQKQVPQKQVPQKQAPQMTTCQR
jgi:hypothetical protein